MSQKLQRHSWTKEEIKKLVKVWDTHTIDEVAQELKLDRQQVQYMVNEIRKAGVPLAKKHRKGYLQNLIKEALNIKK